MTLSCMQKTDDTYFESHYKLVFQIAFLVEWNLLASHFDVDTTAKSLQMHLSIMSMSNPVFDIISLDSRFLSSEIRVDLVQS
jgi:hypothetical protein